MYVVRPAAWLSLANFGIVVAPGHQDRTDDGNPDYLVIPHSGQLESTAATSSSSLTVIGPDTTRTRNMPV